tara:strand:+ start:3888 stop:4670 length:783 start_codon:yes stop_codon:yes gene_type:complete
MTEKKYFLTFANKSYMSTERLHGEVKRMNIFDKIIQANEDYIVSYIQKHIRFIKRHRPGFGFWIWKPKIIFDTLNKIEENDVLMYCDAGMYANEKGKDRFYYYIEQLKEKDMVVFSTNKNFKSQMWVKNDAIMEYYPDFNNQLNNYCYAGIMIIKKTQKTLDLIRDWLSLCQNYHFLNKNPSFKHKENPIYIGNDCDNGLFNLCLAKHNIHFTVEPDEINIYTNEGKQIAHENIDHRSVDWSSLENIPFQCRRMTPKFGF